MGQRLNDQHYLKVQKIILNLILKSYDYVIRLGLINLSLYTHIKSP